MATRAAAATASRPTNARELQRLRRENAKLRGEQEILKKAAAWFARETGSIRSKSSNS
jgi:transposase